MAFNNNILGNYLTGSFFGNFNAQQSPFLEHSVILQIENFSHTGTSKGVNVADELVNNPINKPLFWSLYFYGSKSNDGAEGRCILVSREEEKTMLSCRLEFECTNNIFKYEALIQGIYKAIGLNI